MAWMLDTWRREDPEFPIDEILAAFEALPNKDALLDDLRINLLSARGDSRCEANITRSEANWPLWVLMLRHPTQGTGACWAFFHSPMGQAVRPLTSILAHPPRDQYWTVGGTAAAALVRALTPLTDEGRRTLLGFLVDGSAEVRRDMASALAPLEDRQIVDALAAHVHDSAVGPHARQAIRQHGAPEAISRLLEELAERPNDVTLLTTLVDAGEVDAAVARFDELPPQDAALPTLVEALAGTAKGRAFLVDRMRREQLDDVLCQQALTRFGELELFGLVKKFEDLSRKIAERRESKAAKERHAWATRPREAHPRVDATVPWRVFVHADGRSWRIRSQSDAVEISMSFPDGEEPVARARGYRDSAEARRDMDALIGEQRVDGFTEVVTKESDE